MESSRPSEPNVSEEREMEGMEAEEPGQVAGRQVVTLSSIFGGQRIKFGCGC